MSNPLLSLPTRVEQRISGWIKIQERQAARSKAQPPRPAITLSRQFGCEGFPLSLRLQALLEAATQEAWTIFDRALLDKVASDEGVSRRLLTDLEEEPLALEKLGFHPRGDLSPGEAFTKVALIITSLAKTGHVIIVGRGGAILCQDLPHVYHFRLVASYAWRVAAMVRRAGLDEDQAAQLVKTQGRLRARFIQRTLGADVEDPHYYDAIFNNERHPVEPCAAAICAYVLAGPENAGLSM